MFKRGIINHKGKFNSEIKTPRLKGGNEKKNLSLLGKDETATSEDITITQKDIRKVTVSEGGAIRSALPTILLRRFG